MARNFGGFLGVPEDIFSFPNKVINQESEKMRRPGPNEGVLPELIPPFGEVNNPVQNNLGVCYGMNGDRLPSPNEIVKLYINKGYGKMRLYAPNENVLKGLENTGIKVMLGVPNDEVKNFAKSKKAAVNWVNTYVARFSEVNFEYIVVGNEVDPLNPETKSIAPYLCDAMTHISEVIDTLSSTETIRVSTAISMRLLRDPYIPSNCSFNVDIYDDFIQPILSFLKDQNSPLLVNVYPYIYYIENKASKAMRIAYPLFQSRDVAVQDEGLGYNNLFDAMVDAVYWALEKAGAGSLKVVVSETGWPSDGRSDNGVTTSQAASTYIKNLKMRVTKGPWTPKKPNIPIETYIYAILDESRKHPGYAKHFGLFDTNLKPKYPSV